MKRRPCSGAEGGRRYGPPKHLNGARSALRHRLLRRRAPARPTTANTAPKAKSGPVGAGPGAAAHETLVVEDPWPVQLFPVQLELPDPVAETEIFALRMVFRASMHWVRFPPTSM